MRTPTIFIVLTAMILAAAPADAATINLPPGDSIQAAITSASDGDEIVLAAGTYVEAIDFLGKAITVRSASGDPADTIIDGNGAFHVVQCVSGERAGTVLEGVTITGGNADGVGLEEYGGGMYNEQSSPTVRNCTISGNTAVNGGGGGVCNNGSSPTLINCTFSGNLMSGYNGGGGMYNFNDSAPALTDCTFTANSAIGNVNFSHGGGMVNVSSTPTLTNCTFSGNTATWGGAMYNLDSSPTVINCTVSGNTAEIGGGMHNTQFSNPTVTNCTFSGNTADYGGAMANVNSYSFRGATVTNCTFSGNVAEQTGGALYNETTYSIITVTNCIFWGDSPNEIDSPSHIQLVVTSCNVQGGYAGLGNVNAAPLFMDADGADNIVGTLDDDARLTAGSPCIDAGDDAAVPIGVTSDADGNDRFVDGDGNGTAIVDMGAYEFAAAPCVGDTDGNGAVDIDDLVAVILDWGSSGSANGGDVDGSSVVDCDDLVAVILGWGDCR